MKFFRNGLLTGLALQFAIGPVFFYIINLTLQKTIFHGLIGALAVAIIDFSYVGLAILGIGKILENKKVKKIFGIISSVILVIFGFIIIKGITNIDISNKTIGSISLLSSFVSVLLLTISNPITIVLYTGILGTRGIDKDYTKKGLFIFGFGIGMATLIFMSASVSLFSVIKGGVPLILIQTMNLVVGCLLIGYGGLRFIKVLK
ncbi:MAG: LysE family transporter [Candidatus Pacebacteria bacterium]|jgi:threonine/homoserine/homoserine lactone efflux protein|nr:LysE family transporter [Candidatus Paceibacterota bacterium]